jgi:hypothetical protein
MVGVSQALNFQSLTGKKHILKYLEAGDQHHIVMKTMLSLAFDIIGRLHIHFNASQVWEVLLQHQDCRAKFVRVDARS